MLSASKLNQLVGKLVFVNKRKNSESFYTALNIEALLHWIPIIQEKYAYFVLPLFFQIQYYGS